MSIVITRYITWTNDMRDECQVPEPGARATELSGVADKRSPSERTGLRCGGEPPVVVEEGRLPHKLGVSSCNTIGGGNSHMFGCSPRFLGGDDPIWGAYYSNGLKTPTRIVCQLLCFGCWYFMGDPWPWRTDFGRRYEWVFQGKECTFSLGSTLTHRFQK